MRFFKDMLSKSQSEDADEPEGPAARPEAQDAGFAPDASAWEAAGAGPAAPQGSAEDDMPTRIPRPKPPEDSAEGGVPDLRDARSAPPKPAAAPAAANASAGADPDGGDLDALRRALLELGDTEEEIDAYLAEETDDEPASNPAAGAEPRLVRGESNAGKARMEAAVAAAIKPGASQRKAVARRASIAKQEAQEAALGPRLSEQADAAEPDDDPVPTPRIANEPLAARPAAARKIWDLEDGDDAPEAAAEEPAPKPVAEAAPVQTGSGRASRRAGRVKTRLLGFQPVDDLASDIFETANGAAKKAGATGTQVMFPVGWIVVAEGDGRGASFTLFSGVSQIGRGDDQAIKLDFGDTSISRSNHAAVAYDEETGKFFLGHGGKSNIVRLNGKPVLSTEELTSNDVIRIGETTLRFIALCGDDFDWTSDAGDTAGQAAVG